MKKTIGLILAMMTSNAFAFPETLMTCTLLGKDEQITISISKDDDPIDELGPLFAVAESDKSQFKTELFSRLKWRDLTNHYSPQLYNITGKNFTVSNDFDGTIFFSGVIFNKVINQKMNCR